VAELMIFFLRHRVLIIAVFDELAARLTSHGGSAPKPPEVGALGQWGSAPQPRPPELRVEETPTTEPMVEDHSLGYDAALVALQQSRILRPSVNIFAEV
jgi:hypothetical protein